MAFRPLRSSATAALDARRDWHRAQHAAQGEVASPSSSLATSPGPLQVDGAGTASPSRLRIEYIHDDRSMPLWARGLDPAVAPADRAAAPGDLETPRSVQRAGTALGRTGGNQSVTPGMRAEGEDDEDGNQQQLPGQLLQRFPRFSITHWDVADVCAICLQEVGVGEEVVRLPCLYVFHTEEIEVWLSDHATCPTHVTTNVV